MRTPIPASQLAFSLQHEFIAHLDQEVVHGLIVEPSRLRQYEGKVLLYRLAAVMRALFQEEADFPPYRKVREELERLVFHAGPTEEGLKKLADVKAALIDLNELLLNPTKAPSWSRAWLLDLGIDEANPVTLVLFGGFWKTFLDVSQTAIREFAPF